MWLRQCMLLVRRMVFAIAAWNKRRYLYIATSPTTFIHVTRCLLIGRLTSALLAMVVAGPEIASVAQCTA